MSEQDCKVVTESGKKKEQRKRKLWYCKKPKDY